MPASLSAPALAFIAAALACAGLAELAAARSHGRAPRESGGRLGAHTTPDRPRWRGRRRPGALSVVGLRLLAAAGRALRPLARVAAPGDLAARVAAAGRPGGLGARELMAAKLTAALAGGAWGAAIGVAAPGRLGLATALAGPVAGFLAPDVWLVRRAAERFRRARRELPALLDLLRVTIEAGVPLAGALGSVGERSSGTVGREWRAAAREVELGVPLREALDGMAARLPLPEVESLCGALARAARHGTPPAAALAAQARDARLAERRRVQEHAARAGPKIQLVVALLLVPSVLLLVAAALAGALLSGDGSLVVGG
ncbi:MAG: type II secretion system F family protein [Thermoleophilaceae bacterium]